MRVNFLSKWSFWSLNVCLIAVVAKYYIDSCRKGFQIEWLISNYFLVTTEYRTIFLPDGWNRSIFFSSWNTNGWKSCWHPTIPPRNENWPISGNRATTCKYSTCTCTSLVVSIPTTDHCPLPSFQRFSLRLFRCLLDCQSSIDLLERDTWIYNTVSCFKW